MPRPYTTLFPAAGGHLQRYAAVFPAVEINSSFYRPHRQATYNRWAATVPDAFRFAVKVPRTITHHARLADTAGLLDEFLAQVMALGEKLGPLLVQLPPSLEFCPAVARSFLASLRERFAGQVTCEPRHATWFSPDADALLAESRVARVAADPAVVGAAAKPGGWSGLVYYRLHGSPRVYYSAYPADYRAALADRLIEDSKSAIVWCIFDNTAESAATTDAWDVLTRVHVTPGKSGDPRAGRIR
ncbi:MAG: DUF72 domain-containing protein [Gemmataceae bacterium]